MALALALVLALALAPALALAVSLALAPEQVVVVALDEPTAKHVRGLGVATYVRSTLRSRTGSTDNHATSGLKFAVLRDFIVAGCSVLLSDVDVVWLQNPFTLPSLYRDVDVEGMTDGWDDPSNPNPDPNPNPNPDPDPITLSRTLT